MNHENECLVVIPKKLTHPRIASGSGIVATVLKCGQLVRLYFEGNIYGACNLHSFQERITLAAYRLLQRSPTVAFEVIPAFEFAENFEVVGYASSEGTQLQFHSMRDDADTLMAQWASLYQQ